MYLARYCSQRERPRGLCPRAPAKGTRPLGFPSFGGEGWGRALAPVPLPHWYSPQGRSPAYPFFRKEKIQPHRRRRNCDAESLERVLLRSYPLRRKESPVRRRELFSLRKKRTAGIRLSAWQEEGSLYRLDPTPFSASKKALKNYGFQGDLIPLARAREQSSRGLPAGKGQCSAKPLTS